MRTDVELLEGAFLIAHDEYPSLDVAAAVREVDALAAPLDAYALAGAAPAEQARTLSAHLFERLGFNGNREDYYDPRNSFLNDVIARRTGIPISLSVLYIEVARRVGVAVAGVGFPGHFLVSIEAREGARVFVDPFGGGRVLDSAALERLHSPVAPEHLAPVDARQILVRMLMNLRGIHAARADYRRLLLVLDRLVDLVPDGADELRDRGVLTARLGAPGAALHDLSRYLDLAPHAGDVAEVRRLIEQLEKQGAAARSN